MRGCQWSTIPLSWEMLPDRGEVPVSINQSVSCMCMCQVIGYEKSQRTGHTDVILSSYILLHQIRCCMYEECSLSYGNYMFWTDFPCLHYMPYSWSRESLEPIWSFGVPKGEGSRLRTLIVSRLLPILASLLPPSVVAVLGQVSNFMAIVARPGLFVAINPSSALRSFLM